MIDDRTAYRNQVIAALAVSLGSLAGGMGKGYSSPAMASLQAEVNSTTAQLHTRFLQPFTVSRQQASWITSLSLLGALVGGVFVGCLMKFGRKRALLYISMPYGASWLLTAFANSVYLLYATSFFAGFFTAIVTMITQVYISETTVANSRGGLSSLSKILNQLGVLVSFTVGAFCSWRGHALVITFAPVMLFISIAFLPETPSFLLLSGKDDRAAESLQWFRGPTVDVRREIAIIRSNIAKGKTTAALSVGLIRPILITCGVMFFQRFTGAYAFNFYAVSILKASLRSWSPHTIAIVMSFVQLLASCLSGLLIDKVGRLPLLKWSGAFMCLALAGFGTYSYYLPSTRLGDWAPTACVLTFTVAFSLGISPISWLLIGELFPFEHRGTGSALASTFSYLCAFVNVKTFVDFQAWLDTHGTFWLYAGISVVGLVFVSRCVPETMGREMDEMHPGRDEESLCIKR